MLSTGDRKIGVKLQSVFPADRHGAEVNQDRRGSGEPDTALGGPHNHVDDHQLARLWARVIVALARMTAGQSRDGFAAGGPWRVRRSRPQRGFQRCMHPLRWRLEVARPGKTSGPTGFAAGAEFGLLPHLARVPERCPSGLRSWFRNLFLSPFPAPKRRFRPRQPRPKVH